MMAVGGLGAVPSMSGGNQVHLPSEFFGRYRPVRQGSMAKGVLIYEVLGVGLAH